MLKALLARFSCLCAFALACVGCTVQPVDTPGLAGPSEFAQSFRMTATPDTINHDGGSQSAIILSAFGANGTPRTGAAFRLDMEVDGQVQDYGTLSFKSVTTGADGRASTVYTAPPAPPAGANPTTCKAVPGTCVTIVATPISSNFETATRQFVEIRLVPPGVILPPAGTPTASFIFSPTTPSANTAVQFDASASTSPNETIVSYAWDFGDGSNGSGKTAAHVFSAAQTYSVTLTVTNDRGRSASVTKTVTVAAATVPTAAFVFSPTAPTVKTEVFFDASDSRAGNGHRIVGYAWNWGDGDSASASSSPLQEHDYQSAGTFRVVLTVTDESGQIGTTSQTVTVAAGGPTASFFLIKDPSIVLRIHVDGSASTASGAAAVAGYTWSWGDGSADTTVATPKAEHIYGVAGTYNVRLTVTDSLGRSATSAATSVTVP